MKAKLNNLIFRYENERSRIKVNRELSWSEKRRLEVIDEVLRALSSLRN